ncbi:MAG: sodium:solute symporter family transporter, partial [Planctomycetota bacterium]
MDLNSIGIQTNFSTLDWCIVIGYLAVIVGIGVYITKYIANATDFIVAGRGLKTFLAIATMIGTELGLVTVMYAAQKGFTGGFAAFHIAFAAAIVTLIVGLTGFIVVPLRRMRVMTIPEFYEKRFGRGVRILGGIILAFSGILNMGMFLKAGSLFV